MNKGQFPLAIAALLALAAMYKMPAEDVSRLVFEVLHGFTSGYIAGWALAGTVAVGWFIHVKWQRRIINQEIERISLERTQLQQKLLADKVSSSE